jgi:hypothetical protein
VTGNEGMPGAVHSDALNGHAAIAKERGVRQRTSVGIQLAHIPTARSGVECMGSVLPRRLAQVCVVIRLPSHLVLGLISQEVPAFQSSGSVVTPSRVISHFSC